MKKNSNPAAAKKARKAFKKELTEKIVLQLKTSLGETSTDSKKTNKAIEKAAKNLAKKIAKYLVINKPMEETTVKTETADPAANAQTEIPAKIVKTKTTPVKRATPPAK